MTELTHEQKPGWLSRPLWATMNLDWEKGIYLAFILIAIVSRFWGLGDRVMSHDESLHTQFSYQFYNGEGYNHTPLMHGPFLFHITAVSYWLLGDSDFSARVPVALFGVVLVVLPYLLRRWLGRVGALFASFFFLISPYITYYSRYIRHDIYVIVWAMMVFIAIMYYLHDRQEKYLWWFAAGTALMFATKEVSFIYVAIFGSYLIIRLWPQMVAAPWFKRVLPRLRAPILLVGVGVLLLGAGLIGKEVVTTPTETAVSTTTAQGFAADPNQATVGDTTETADGRALPFRILQLVGVGVLSAGLFLAVREMRPHIDQYPEFDLITLFTTLVLPTVSPLLVTMAGWNPRDYGINKCLLEGQESMSSLQLFLARMTNSVCISSFLNSGMVRSGFFLLLTLAVAVLVGLWWHNRRWLIAAGIFHAIFAVLYTSVFTNPGGWASGMIGSLGYWLEQQGVQRGSQPGFYYFFVVPFYEFLPVLFSLAAIWLWSKQHQLNKIAGYWLGLILSSLLLFSLTNWLFNRSAVAAGAETTAVPGVIFALLLFFLGVLYWFFVRRGQLLAEYGLRRNFNGLFKRELVCETVPFLTWWLALTWVAYTIAGEKMPWLSTHFVIPMGLLGGWYFAERLRPFSWRDLLNRTTAVFFGLTVALFVALFLTIAPLWLGQVQLGNQQLNNLRGIGRFLGGLLTTGIIFYFWRDWQAKIGRSLRNFTLIFSLFTLLAILTIRFTYLASFPNADYSIEFLNYAHGAPATKEAVLAQVEELSMRLYGDKSIKVAFDNDSSWPFTWYLRDYPNRLYFGENPSNAITDAPVIIVGSLNWGKVEPFLGDNYTQQTFTFLWWPMEEYRKFSWNAIFGTPENGRGLGNPGVR
ncbi:MAG: TIGR03663 family protein, partial [Chloroflexi bacterium]